jgi:TRAP-type C4-dicarboxylate transport system permease small subunit
VVSIIAVLLCMVYVGFVLVGSTAYVSKMHEIGVELEDMPIERWKVLIVMPLGYCAGGFPISADSLGAGHRQDRQPAPGRRSG